MIKISISDDVSKQSTTIFSLYMYRYMILLLILIIPVCIALTIVGYKNDVYALKSMGIALIFIEAIYIIYTIYLVSKNRRISDNIFQKNYPLGERILEISKNNDEITISDVILNVENKYTKEDFKKVFHFCNIIIVKLIDGQFLYFPYQNEIYEILKK